MGHKENRNTVLVLAVAVLAVLAGCNGGQLGGGSDAAYTSSGEGLNGTELRADHVEQLESAGSFTSVLDLRVESGDGDARFNQTTAVNQTRDRAYQSRHISAGGAIGTLKTESYTEGDVTFERLVLGSGDNATVRYRHGSGDDVSAGAVRPVNVTNAMNARLVGQAAANINWTQTGIVDREGETVTRYEATGRKNFSDFRNATDLGTLEGLDANATDSTVDSVNATLYVGPDGLVHEFHFSFAGTSEDERTALEFTVRTTKVGLTNVDPPAWLDEARAETGG